MDSPKPTSAPSPRPGHPAGGDGAANSAQLLAKARAETTTLLQELASRLEGLSQAEADARLKQVGPNEIAREKRQSPLMRLLDNVKDPLVILLLALGVISFLTGDLRAMVVIFVMVRAGRGAAFLPGDARRSRGREAQGDGQQHGDGGARRGGSGNTAQAVGAGRHHPPGRR